MISKDSSCDFRHYLVSFGGDAISTFQRNGVEVMLIKGSKTNIRHLIRIFLQLFRICKEKEIRILHSHHRYFDLVSHIISKMLGIRTITSVHSVVHGYRTISYKAETIVAVSKSIEKHLIQEFSINPSRIAVINNFINPNHTKILFSSDEIKLQLQIPENMLIIGYIGRKDIREKGIDILLTAFTSLYNGNDNLCLIMVGNGPDYKFVNKYEEEKRINIRNISAKSNIYDYYAICDIIVLPSRVEPFGMVVLESGIMKKCFIGSRVGGIPEIIQDEVDGLLFQSDDPKELEAKIKRLIENKDLRNALAQQLWWKVNTHYSSKVVIPKLNGIYNKVAL